MDWYIYAFASAIFWGIFLVLEKQVLKKEHSFEYSISRLFCGAILVFLLIPLISNFNIGLRLFGILYITSLLATGALLLRAKSLRFLDISVVSPFMTFSPLLVMLLAFFFLNELVTSRQMLGVGIIVFGAYTIMTNGHLRRFSDPWKLILQSRSMHYIFLALFLLSLEALLQEYLVDGFIGPYVIIFYLWIFMFFNVLILSFVRYGGVKEIQKGIKLDGVFVIFAAAFSVMSGVFSIIAYSKGPVSLVLSIKQLGAVFATILGGGLFHEQNQLIRIFSAIIMFAGAYLILV